MDQLFNNDIELIEPEHRYALKSNPEIEFTSVTSLTSKYFEPFNKFEVAKRLVETNVKYFGMTVDQLIAKWDESRDFGTLVHNMYRIIYQQ